MSKKTSTLIAFVAGAAAGTLAGILLAPEKGQQTRKKLVSQADTFTHEVSSQLKTGSSHLRKLADQAVHQVEKLGKKVGAA